jgi:hypothetical protein
MKMSSDRKAAWLRMTVTGLWVSVAALAANQALGQAGVPRPPSATGTAAATNQETEIALALSACPPALAKDAGVYVLGKSGYVKVRDSRNGFTAIVEHSKPGSQEPQCIDAEGARSWLPRVLMVAQLRAAGKSREEIQHTVADAVEKGILKPPSRPGVIYMLSPQNRPPNFKGKVTAFPPHVMFYAPNLANADIGVDNSKLAPDGNPEGPAFVILEKTPYALLIAAPMGSHEGMTHAMPGTEP